MLIFSRTCAELKLLASAFPVDSFSFQFIPLSIQFAFLNNFADGFTKSPNSQDCNVSRTLPEEYEGAFKTVHKKLGTYILLFQLKLYGKVNARVFLFPGMQ